MLWGSKMKERRQKKSILAAIYATYLCYHELGKAHDIPKTFIKWNIVI